MVVMLVLEMVVVLVVEMLVATAAAAADGQVWARVYSVINV